MDFDDSYFEEAQEGEKEKRAEEAVAYHVKLCPPGWFMVAGMECSQDPVVLKYQADLCYGRRDYQWAARLYRSVLASLPPSNLVVGREVRDSLARCNLQLGLGQQALQLARTLVAPPHANDASSWQLLGMCQKCCGHTGEWLLCLLRCVSLQRCDWFSWSLLHLALSSLSSTCCPQQPTTQDSDVSFDAIFSNTEAILNRIVELFRPYFKWKTKNDAVAHGHSPGCLPFPAPDGVFYLEEDLSHVFLLLARCLSVQDILSRYHQLSRERGAQLLGATLHIASCCSLIWERHLLLYLVRHSSSSSSSTTTISPSSSSTTTTSSSTSTTTSSSSPSSSSSSSSSFPLRSHRARLEEVEARLAHYHGNLTCYLLACFNKTTIFESKGD